jgi:hypothetical protein
MPSEASTEGAEAGFACSADHDERLQIDDAILDFDDPRRSTHVLDAVDNPHCQHLAVSSGRQAQRRTFAPRKTTALYRVKPLRSLRFIRPGRRGGEDANSPRLELGYAALAGTAELPSVPHDGA